MCVLPGRRIKGDILWWNEEMKEAISWKKDAHKIICQNSSEENKKMCKGMKRVYNAASKAIREECEEVITELIIIQMDI